MILILFVRNDWIKILPINGSHPKQQRSWRFFLRKPPWSKFGFERTQLQARFNLIAALQTSVGRAHWSVFDAQNLRYRPQDYGEVASFVCRSSLAHLDYVSVCRTRLAPQSTHLNVFQILMTCASAVFCSQIRQVWKSRAMNKLTLHYISCEESDEGIALATVINHVQPGPPVQMVNGETAYRPQAILSKFF